MAYVKGYTQIKWRTQQRTAMPCAHVCQQWHVQICNCVRSLGQEHRSKLRTVQCAYSVLSDPTKRARYDIRNGFYNHTDKVAKLIEVERVQKERAQRATEMMGGVYEDVYKREVERRGVLIDKSWYGNLRLKQAFLDNGYKGPVTSEHIEGPWIDVTIPIQCQVNSSRLIVPGGPSSSKSDLEGFYNPTANIDSMDLCLYVLYHFQGDLHEVTVTDKQPLAIPLKSHKLTTRPSGPFDPSNVSSRRPAVPPYNEFKQATKQMNGWNEESAPSDEWLHDAENIKPILLPQRGTAMSRVLWIPLTATAIWTSAYVFFNYYDRESVVLWTSTFLKQSLPSTAQFVYERMYTPCIAAMRPAGAFIQSSVNSRLVHPMVHSRAAPFFLSLLSSPPIVFLCRYFTRLYSLSQQSLQHLIASLPSRPCWVDVTSAIYNSTIRLLPPQPSAETVAQVNGLLGTDTVKSLCEGVLRVGGWRLGKTTGQECE
eukprot:GHVS01049195.1.p1 GENE.GHVS01049195.1~~GHVS01049195.1.p1  ORF type:complete len:482 (+),score=37.38 GHVS01049195.1:217-1662(+)